MIPSFSPRQLAVLVAYARTGDQREAAYRLGITVRCLKRHLTVVYRKLDVTNMLEAMQAMGWLRVPEELVA